MLQPVPEFPSFLRLNNIPLHLYITFYLSGHPGMDTWVASMSWLLRNNATVNMGVRIFLQDSAFNSFCYSRVELSSLVLKSPNVCSYCKDNS